MVNGDEKSADITAPPECFLVDNVPHDWLFPKIDVALHHGGAGTTAASLRAGIPTIIKPWFGDQFFWAARVQKLGVRSFTFFCLELAGLQLRGDTGRIASFKFTAE